MTALAYFTRSGPVESLFVATPTPVSEQDVLGILRGVLDPELGDNIVDLGMVRGAEVHGDRVTITIALTTAGCPLRAQIKKDVQARVATLPGVEGVDLTWDELNATEKARVMERARAHAREAADPTEVPLTTRVLAIASGKGGVGKSSLTVNLACELAGRGFVVGVLDADIWGFSVPRMLGIEGRLAASEPGPDGDRPKIVPHERPIGDGLLKVISTGFLVEEEGTALMWRGLMLAKAVEQFLKDVAWGEMDYLLIDMPPGTGDVQMGLSRMLPQAEMIVVTTPALAAQRVAVRVADMARRSHMPVLGVIENMSAFVTEDGRTYPLFGEGGGKALADEVGRPLLGSVPLEPSVSAGGDEGRPVVLDGRGPAAAAIASIVDRLVDDVAPPVDMQGCSARLLAAVDAALD
jgi:ATP-binding protein involved in chromosome partitioning